MDELYSSLKVIEAERVAQVNQVKLKYKEIKVTTNINLTLLIF